MSQYPGATYYVSPQGDDRWSGALPEPNATGSDGPFATPAKARDAVRAREDRSAPMTVLLRGGTYFLEEPLRFEPADSGTADAPITWAAYPGELPVLSAGQRVGGWEETELICKPPDNWEDEPEIPRRAWVTQMEGPAFRQLWVNGGRRYRPRLPHRGLYKTTGLPPGAKPRGEFSGCFTQYRIDPDILGEWRNLGQVEMVMLVRWLECRMPIQSVDRETGLVDTVTGAPFLPAKHWESREWERFYLDNVFEALLEPGGWYLDQQESKLYYLPYPEETLETTEVVAPRFPYVILVAGDPDADNYLEYLHFQGLTLAHNEWHKPEGQPWWGFKGNQSVDGQAAVSVPGAFEAVGMRHSRLSHCTMAHVGTYGIQLGRGCKENEVSHCDLFDLGAGGVKLGTVSMEDTEISGHNTIADCHIHDGGLFHHSAVGLWIGQSGHNLIAHNEINHLHYSGVSVGWCWNLDPTGSHDNVLEYNHIHDIGQGWLSDMGGVYTLGDSPGTVLRYNLIHHVRHGEFGGRGIYHDAWCSNVLDEYNVVYRCDSECINFQHGHGNVARNNLLALGGELGVIGHACPDEDASVTLEGNILYTQGCPAVGGNYEHGEYHFRRNLYWDADGRPLRFGGLSFEEWQKQGLDQDSVIADPRSAHPGAGDFTLPDDSPALALGFKPFDLSTVGPRGKVGAGSG